MDEPAVQVMAALPDEEARMEVLELLGQAQSAPRSFPDVREIIGMEVREAFGPFSWLQYAVLDGEIEVRDIGWMSCA
ncbi:hypothetical protein ACWGJ2_02885 [Streptomyces sp. NPDC054796]